MATLQDRGAVGVAFSVAWSSGCCAGCVCCLWGMLGVCELCGVVCGCLGYEYNVRSVFCGVCVCVWSVYEVGEGFVVCGVCVECCVLYVRCCVG